MEINNRRYYPLTFIIILFYPRVKGAAGAVPGADPALVSALVSW